MKERQKGYNQVDYIEGDLTFKWDENKNRSNITKHGIDFRTAALVFNDPNYIDIYDERHSFINEERHLIIGTIGKVILVVRIFYGQSTRIISARLATDAEEEIYYGR